ncbi:ATP-binding protein [Algoriphagus boritolerans]|uniref:sensor histidine kinase n=1 Tax=Algoriphagus boritolerans TaxID=308111 RepID=UPI000A7624D9
MAAAERKGLGMVFNFNAPSFHAKLDRRFVEMIVNNVVSNSIKYTEKGRITVTCGHVANQISLEVTDTGVGMSKEFQSKMFDPSSRKVRVTIAFLKGLDLG